ncbi:MAG: hypothetical protein WKF80_11030, partial [Thermomicrobiales bacterium]
MSVSSPAITSSYREMVLEHLFVGSLMRHVWLRDGGRIEFLRPRVDDAGYDLVLEANNVLRHVQLKSSQIGAAAPGVNIHAALASKPSGCVVWMRFDQRTLDFSSFLFFGGEPGAPLPGIESLKVTKHAKANAQGVKTERPNLRFVPKAMFRELWTLDLLITRLFG